MAHHEKEISCPSCKSKNLSYHTENITISYKGTDKILSDLEYTYCHTCTESFYTRNTEKRLDKETADFERTIDNLLTSEEIKSIRKKCGLTQDQDIS